MLCVKRLSKIGCPLYKKKKATTDKGKGVEEERLPLNSFAPESNS